MGRSRIAIVAAALVATSSVALALSVPSSHWMGTIVGKDGSNLTGSGMMMASKDGKSTEVMVDFKGDTPDATRPWHVHTGSCAKTGAPWGGMRPYTPIQVNKQGNGESMATIELALPDTGSYNVNIHESSANMSRIVACSDLQLVK
jgi:FtsP/CotA-like multicopper oxidase with cupredoxin domain